MEAREESEPDLVRDLSGGGQLDRHQLKRIEDNPFILNDGVLRVGI